MIALIGVQYEADPIAKNLSRKRRSRVIDSVSYQLSFSAIGG